MRVLELFAGAGGMALGFHRAGWETVALAEWDAHAQCVLRARFPGVPLYGDVQEMDGREVVASHGPVDLVSGGAPCQDLSVAGKRAGLDGSRSVLFYDLIRLWEETGATYCLYENVLGALSSHKGADFAAVLAAFVGRAVPVPRDGWTGGGGVVAGPAGVAAWRVLDAQFFGVPQRRRRVFVLGARPGGVSPEQVLLEWDGGGWHPETSGEAGQGVTRDTAGGAGGGVEVVNALDTECGYGKATFQTVLMGHIVPALPASGAGTARTGNERTEAELVVVQEAIPILEATARQGVNAVGSVGVGKPGDPMFTLQATKQHGVFQEAVAFHENQRGELRELPVFNALAGGGGKPGQGYPAVLQPEACYPIDTRNATRTTDKSAQNRQGSGVGNDGDPSPTITGLFVPAVVHIQPEAVAINNDSRAEASVGVTPPLRGGNRAATAVLQPEAVAFSVKDSGADASVGLSPTLRAMGHRESHANGGGQIGVVCATGTITHALTGEGHDASEDGTGRGTPITAPIGRPRRLLPIETERLMGWPDDWTLVPDPKGKPMADSHRYKMCGNGVVSHIAQWIAESLLQAEANAEPLNGEPMREAA